VTSIPEKDRELRDTLSLLRTTLEATADGILVVDLERRVRTFNQRFLAMWGIPPELAASEQAADLVTYGAPLLADPEEYIAGVERLFGNPEYSFVDDLLFADGRVFERSSQPQLMDSQIIGRVCSFRDVTDRRRLERQLMLAQKLEAIGRLAGGIAHDFNNILTVINNEAALLKSDLPPEDARHESASEILKAGKRAADLTRQLLAYSRQQVLEPHVLDLNDLLSNLEGMIRRLLRSDIELHTVTAHGLGAVRADSGQVEQVVMNLAVNARDAMPEGGKLTIETANVELDAGYAMSHVPVRAGSYVVLSISDTGSGMTRDQQAKIFEPFYTTKEKGKGTGLGLSTVYGIVKQSEGYIWVYSEPSEGSTFKIYLPRVDAVPEPRTSHPLSEDIGSRGETVLIAEDDDAVRNVVRAALTRNGYVVLEARNGTEAIAVFRNDPHRIDCLLTDMIMPGMSGPDLAAAARELAPRVKVLFMSGYADRDLISKGRMAAHEVYLEKPFASETLLAKLRYVLAGSGGAASARRAAGSGPGR
jgi:two-component system cell cycle sensor histidine kinase/response regulator CckA